MNSEIEKRLALLKHARSLIDSQSLLEMGFLLESTARGHDRMPQKLLSQELCSLQLDKQDEQAIIELAFELIENRDMEGRSSLFWLVSKGSAEFVFEPLIKAIHLHDNDFDDETACQALFALDSMLRFDQDGHVTENQVELLRRYDILKFLSRMNTPKTSLRIRHIGRITAGVREAISDPLS